MSDIDEIRRANLRLLEGEAGSTTEAARRCEMTPSQFANLRDGAKDSKTGKPRGMRKETARRVDAAFGKPAGWLDVDRSDKAQVNTGPVQRGNLSLSEALPLVLDAIANSPAKAELKQLLPMLIDTDAAAYRARLAELLSPRSVARPPAAESRDFQPPVPLGIFDKTKQTS